MIDQISSMAFMYMAAVVSIVIGCGEIIHILHCV